MRKGSAYVRVARWDSGAPFAQSQVLKLIVRQHQAPKSEEDNRAVRTQGVGEQRLRKTEQDRSGNNRQTV